MLFLVVGFSFLGLVFFSAFIFSLFAAIRESLNADNLYAVFSSILTGLFLCTAFACHCGIMWWLAFRHYWVYSRKFTINDDGIILTYCNSSAVIYPWKEIVDICVCDVNQNYGGGFDIVIRLGLCRETNGPLNPQKVFSINGYDRWRNGWYLFSNYKNVIYLDYSDQRFERIQQISRRKMIDRRTKLGKSYYISFWDDRA